MLDLRMSSQLPARRLNRSSKAPSSSTGSDNTLQLAADYPKSSEFTFNTGILNLVQYNHHNFQQIVQREPLPLVWAGSNGSSSSSSNAAPPPHTPNADLLPEPEKIGSRSFATDENSTIIINNVTAATAAGGGAAAAAAAADQRSDSLDSRNGRALRSRQPSSHSRSHSQIDPDWTPSTTTTGTAAMSTTTTTSQSSGPAAKKQKKSTKAKAERSGEESLSAEDGKPKTTRVRIPTEKRKMQNRHNQRAFRQRREQHFKEMAVHDETLNQLVQDQKTEIGNMKEIIIGLRAEIADLKQSSSHWSGSDSRSEQPSSTRMPCFPFKETSNAPLPPSQAPSLAFGSSTTSEPLPTGSIEHWLASHDTSGFANVAQPMTSYPSMEAIYPALDTSPTFNLWQQQSSQPASPYSHQQPVLAAHMQCQDPCSQAFDVGYAPFAGYSKEDLFKIVGQPVTPLAL